MAITRLSSSSQVAHTDAEDEATFRHKNKSLPVKLDRFQPGRLQAATRTTRVSDHELSEYYTETTLSDGPTNNDGAVEVRHSQVRQQKKSTRIQNVDDSISVS